jgi:hypothetical protein
VLTALSRATPIDPAGGGARRRSHIERIEAKASRSSLGAIGICSRRPVREVANPSSAFFTGLRLLGIPAKSFFDRDLRQ